MLIDDIEYVIFRHPDPAAARQFMLDYGLLDGTAWRLGVRAAEAVVSRLISDRG